MKATFGAGCFWGVEEVLKDFRFFEDISEDFRIRKAKSGSPPVFFGKDI